MNRITNISDFGLTLNYNIGWTSADPSCTAQAYYELVANDPAGLANSLTLQPGRSAEIPSNFATVFSGLAGNNVYFSIQ